MALRRRANVSAGGTPKAHVTASGDASIDVLRTHLVDDAILFGAVSVLGGVITMVQAIRRRDGVMAALGATIITSQLPIEHWHAWVGDATIADAILDRIVHGAHKIALKGESMRKLRQPA